MLGSPAPKTKLQYWFRCPYFREQSKSPGFGVPAAEHRKAKQAMVLESTAPKA